MLAPNLCEASPALPEIVEINDANALTTEELDRCPLVGFNLSGKLPPLFAVRTWSEEVENYRLLARHLGPDQPIYSVSPPTGSQSSDYPGDTDEWADLCIARFGSLLERDSIALTGWSYAGVVALRVAERLAERGVDVRLVALVDSTLPRRKPKGDSRKRSEARHFFVMMERMFDLEDPGARRLYFKRYAGKVRRRMVKRVKRRLKAVRRAFATRKGVEEAGVRGSKNSSIRDTKSRERRTPLLMRAIRVAYLKHKASAAWIPVSLYWSEESRGRVGDASLGWPRFLRSGFECQPIPGTHHTLYEEPHVRTLASCLSRTLGRIWAEPEPDDARTPGATAPSRQSLQ